MRTLTVANEPKMSCGSVCKCHFSVSQNAPSKVGKGSHTKYQKHSDTIAVPN